MSACATGCRPRLRPSIRSDATISTSTVRVSPPPAYIALIGPPASLDHSLSLGHQFNFLAAQSTFSSPTAVIVLALKLLLLLPVLSCCRCCCCCCRASLFVHFGQQLNRAGDSGTRIRYQRREAGGQKDRQTDRRADWRV